MCAFSITKSCVLLPAFKAQEEEEVGQELMPHLYPFLSNACSCSSSTCCLLLLAELLVGTFVLAGVFRQAWVSIDQSFPVVLGDVHEVLAESGVSQGLQTKMPLLIWAR